MKFTLPTQNAPKIKTEVGELKISPGKRVKIQRANMTMYFDSLVVELVEPDWNLINEWITFHNIIFSDQISLDWYEGESFDTVKLTNEGVSAYLVDYSDISSKVYFPNIYPETLNYEELYKIYTTQTKENKALVKNYFSSVGVMKARSLNRQIRDDSFWRILISFSITESIIGDTPKCSGDVTCNVHGKLKTPHNNILTRQWIKQRLSEIIPDPQIVDEYFLVIWEVRQKIRHRTVHEGVFPESRFIQQNEGEIIWDWAKTTAEWSKDSVALSNLENHMREITRNLLLNRLFDLKYFPALRPLHSIRIISNASAAQGKLDTTENE